MCSPVLRGCADETADDDGDDAVFDLIESTICRMRAALASAAAEAGATAVLLPYGIFVHSLPDDCPPRI
jgi:hypothetical protein